jgi:hypothetical protein
MYESCHKNGKAMGVSSRLFCSQFHFPTCLRPFQHKSSAAQTSEGLAEQSQLELFSLYIQRMMNQLLPSIVDGYPINSHPVTLYIQASLET